MSGTTTTLDADGFPSDPAVLRQRLADVDAAYHALLTGAKVSVVSYGQGNGSKSVTYTRTSLPQLAAYRAQLLRKLGTPTRRAIRLRF